MASSDQERLRDSRKVESERVVIREFQESYRFLSNFWPATVTMNGDVYPTVEHAYQAAKTSDMIERAKIRVCKTPGEAKRVGRYVKIQPNWNAIRLDVMEDLVRDKFKRNPDLGRLLLATKDAELIEGNTWGDTFWGKVNAGWGVGENHLGKIIMKIRGEL